MRPLRLIPKYSNNISLGFLKHLQSTYSLAQHSILEPSYLAEKSSSQMEKPHGNVLINTPDEPSLRSF